jgi:membrane protein implicated in regulation of membrane protease activity
MFSLPIWAIWLILCGLFLLIETFTISFLMFWPGLAAFVAFILAILNFNLNIQIAVFSILSIVLIFSTKPLIKRFLKENHTITNAKTVIGKQGIVLKEIDNLYSKGQVKISGEVWSASSETDDIIPIDSTVEVTAIDGVKVRVKKV